MTALASTDVSISLDPRDRHILGKIKMSNGTLSFGDGALTYPYGGVPMPAIGNFGMNKEVTALEIVDNSGGGLIYRYDQAERKMKIFAQAPPIVFEEVVTLTANLTGTTKYPMAWPIYASNGNQALGLMPTGMTPVTKTIALNMHSATPGTRATITAKATDTYTTVTITYITQAWKEVFDNLVEGETMAVGATNSAGTTFTAGTPDVIAFTHALCGIMVGLNLNGTMSCPKPVKKGETAVAGEYALDLTLTAATASVSPVTTENWDAATSTVYFNYIKLPASGFIYDRFVEEDSAAAASQIYTHAASKNILQPLLWSTPGFMPSVTLTTTTSATWPIGGIGMTLGATAQWQPTNYNPKNKAVTAGTWTSGTGVLVTLTVKPSYVYGVAEEIPLLEPLEIPNATIIKDVDLKFLTWGK